MCVGARNRERRAKHLTQQHFVPHLTITNRQLHSWTFNPFSFAQEEDELMGVCSYIFASLQLPRLFKLPAANFMGFLEAIRVGMTTHAVPYHNFWHAVDVLQVRRGWGAPNAQCLLGALCGLALLV